MRHKKAKPKPLGEQVVTEDRLAVVLKPYVSEEWLAELLSRFARAADASLTLKMNEMEARLRRELGACEMRDPRYEEGPPDFGDNPPDAISPLHVASQARRAAELKEKYGYPAPSEAVSDV